MTWTGGVAPGRPWNVTVGSYDMSAGMTRIVGVACAFDALAGTGTVTSSHLTKLLATGGTVDRNGDSRAQRPQLRLHGRRIELGGKVGVLGTLIDNTERKRAEEELREADSRFRAFVDHVSDAFTVHDESGNIVDANRQACENLGYTRNELIGMHPRDFDLDVAADEARIEKINQRLAAGETFAFETIHRRKDGTLFPAEVRMRPFRHGGRSFGLALSRDITERKRAEEERERTRRLEQEQQSAIEAERTRLAGEIHDTLAQGLAMIVMQLADAEAKLGAAWARAEKPLGIVRELAVESLAYARRWSPCYSPARRRPDSPGRFATWSTAGNGTSAAR